MERKRYFKYLLAWQKAMELVPVAYEIPRGLPDIERYALADQIRRCAISVPSNIAEGQARQHSKEFIQFLSVSRGSLAELHTLMIAAHSLGYIDDAELGSVDPRIAEVDRLLSGLSNKLKANSQAC